MKDLTNITHRSNKKITTDITQNLKKKFQSNNTPIKLKQSISSTNCKLNSELKTNPK